jgi:hypothetical protein
MTAKSLKIINISLFITVCFRLELLEFHILVLGDRQQIAQSNQSHPLHKSIMITRKDEALFHLRRSIIHKSPLSLPTVATLFVFNTSSYHACKRHGEKFIKQAFDIPWHEYEHHQKMFESVCKNQQRICHFK